MSNINVTEALDDDVEDDFMEMPTIKGHFHGFLRLGYMMAIDHMQNNVAEWGLPQEDYSNDDPPNLKLVS